MIACLNKMFMQKTLNEDVIDYDLLEDLISYIDEVYPVGAILVFLPVSPLTCLFLLWFCFSQLVYSYLSSHKCACVHT